MSPKKLLIINTAILGLGKLSVQIASFLLVPIYTAFLSPADYGLFDLITTYVLLLGPAIVLQIDRASFRMLIDHRDSPSKINKIISITFGIVTLSTLASTILYFTYVAIFDIPYAILIYLMLVSSIQLNLLFQISRGLGNNKLFASSSGVVGMSLIIFALVFVVILDMGIEGTLIAALLSNIMGSIYIFIKLQLYKYFDFGSFDHRLSRDMIKYSAPLIPSAISWWTIQASDRTIISVFLGVAANGIYAVSNRYAAIFMALYAIFDMSWTESASVHINSKNKNKFFSDVYNTSLRIFGSLGFVMISAFSIAFPLLVSSSYRDAYPYFPLLVIGGLFNSMVASYSTVYIAKKLTSKVLRTALIAAVVNVTINLSMINFIGLYAAALSTVAAFFLMTIIRYYDIKKYVQFKYDRGLIGSLVVFYAVILALYYINSTLFNLFSLLVSIGATTWINKDSIKTLRRKLLKLP